MRKADNLPPSWANVMKSGNLNFLEPSGPLQVCNGTAFTYAVGNKGCTCLCFARCRGDIIAKMTILFNQEEDIGPFLLSVSLFLISFVFESCSANISGDGPIRTSYSLKHILNTLSFEEQLNQVSKLFNPALVFRDTNSSFKAKFHGNSYT